MHIENLKLNNFKNYTDLDVDFCRNVNCLVGNNGVGKTNMLDAIYYLSFCKSFFNPQDVMNIRHGEQYFAIHGRYSQVSGRESMQVSCVLQQGHNKQMKCDGKTYKNFAEHIGKLPLVMISPVDQVLILGGSEVRRKFMDGVISQTNKDYLYQLMQYQKALDQRNKLLKQMAEDRYFEESLIEMWDDQLVRYGEAISKERRVFLEKFTILFNEYYQLIAQDREEAVIAYKTQVDAESANMKELLLQSRQKDRYSEFTNVGIHKDDLEFGFGDYAVKRFGSQGQQKSFVLALKLAQFQYIYEVCGEKPILLLDDIFDKLDMDRIRQLVMLVGSDRFGQVFLTDTQPGRVEAIFDDIPDVEHKIFKVEEGLCDEI